MFKVYDIFEPTTPEKNSVCGKYSHGSTLTQLPDGRIMVAWYSGSYEKCADVGIYTSTFDPAKETWTAVKLLEKESSTKSEGNPVLYYDSETKRLWHFWATMDRADYKHIKGGWSTCKVKCKASDDLGQTWSPVRYLTRLWGRMTRNKPVRLANGTVILPMYSEWMGLKGNIWAATREEFAKGPLQAKFKKIGTIPGGVEQPNIVELAPEHLLCFLRSPEGGTFIPGVSVSESYNSGYNWSKIRKGPVPNCNNGLSLTLLKNGKLLLVFNNSVKSRNPLSAAISEDQGLSFPWIRDIENTVNTSPGDRFAYPESIQAADGTFYCSYSNKNCIGIRCVHFDEEWIKSGK